MRYRRFIHKPHHQAAREKLIDLINHHPDDSKIEYLYEIAIRIL